MLPNKAKMYKGTSSQGVEQSTHGKRVFSYVHYAVGQPMGALSSWAMLALTHHLIVQFSYAIGLPTLKDFKPFTDYCILGDDIVIGNHKVAKTYHKVITSLGVECNLSKSIISPKGIGLEFAKKTFYKGENVSPTPLKSYHSALTDLSMFLEFSKTYRLTIPQMLTVAGFGYKVVSGYQRSFRLLNLKVRYLLLLASFSSDKILESLKPQLNIGYTDFLSAFYIFVEEYVVDLSLKATRSIVDASNVDLRAFISQPKW